MVVLARSQQRDEEEAEQNRQEDELEWMKQVASSTTKALGSMKLAEREDPHFSPERTEAVMKLLWNACEDCDAAKQVFDENARLRREAEARSLDPDAEERQLCWNLRHKCLIQILNEAQFVLTSVAAEAYNRMIDGQ